jgi:hypothetical protein
VTVRPSAYGVGGNIPERGIRLPVLITRLALFLLRAGATAATDGVEIHSAGLTMSYGGYGRDRDRGLDRGDRGTRIFVGGLGPR